MAIKINGKSLARRIVNGRDVVRVILNGAEIRPHEVPHVDYHVISPRTGTVPGGWTNNGGTFDGNGIGNGDSGNTINIEYSSLPSLRNAVKIVIVYKIYWTMANVELPFDATLLKSGDREYQSQLEASWSQILGCSSDISAVLSGASAGRYTITATLDLENKEATQVIEGPNGFESDIGTYNLTDVEVNNIRLCDQFIIFLNNGAVINQVDFYIYNASISTYRPMEGFHVPTKTELQTLVSLSNTLGIGYRELKIPLIGFLQYYNGDLSSGTTYLWSNTVSGSTVYTTEVSANAISDYTYDRRAYGQTVRPFYDEYVAPDGTWTQLATGVYRKPSLGLISITDGTNSLTISDKNLGATEVWNDGDALTINNYGGFYQWGNCYGFAMDGLNTSNTQVDTTGYGDGALYTSDTFIIGYQDWSNPQNDSLWNII